MKISMHLPEGWRFIPLERVAEIILSNVDKKSGKGEAVVQLCNYTDVYYNDIIDKNIEFMEATATPREIERFSLRHGDVLITKDSETPDDIAVPALVNDTLENVLCGYHLAILRPRNNSLSGAYLSKLFLLHIVRHYFFILANGVTRFGLTSDSIRKAALPFPSMQEQKRIAALITTWGTAITQAERLIAAKQKLKKGLMQQLLTGKKRLAGFMEQWHEHKLGELFKERNESNGYGLPLLSVTGEIGIIPHSESGRKDSSSEDKRKYKRVTPGDIAYNTMRMWQGVSALSQLEGIVSPAYTICIPKENIYGPYAAHFFKLPKMIHLFYRYSQGLVSDTLNLKFNNFSQIKVAVPSVDEQKMIAAALDNLNSEITFLKKISEQFHEQKRGLMQKLLTGQVRVKI